MKHYVYIYLNPMKKGNFKYDNLEFQFEPFYVGVSKNRRRFHQHIYEAKSGITKNKIKSAIIRKILKIGENPITVKLHENISKEKAYEIEKALISKIGRIIKNEGPLANVLEGGQLSNGEKISNSLKKNKKLNSDKKRIVYQFDLNGNFIREFQSVKDAFKETGVAKIDACCRNERKTSGGYIWKYKHDKYIKTKKYKKRTDRPWNKYGVLVMNNKRELINKYDSVYALPEKFNIRMVKQSCRKGSLYKNHYFKYIK